MRITAKLALCQAGPLFDMVSVKVGPSDIMSEPHKPRPMQAKVIMVNENLPATKRLFEVASVVCKAASRLSDIEQFDYVSEESWWANEGPKKC